VLLHRWLRLPAGWRSIPENIDLLKPYLKQFEAANHNVAEDADGFPTSLFLPSENAIAYSFMGPADRAILHDDNALSASTLDQLMGRDRRVALKGAYNDSPDYLKTLLPLRGRGLAWFDLGLVPTHREQTRAYNGVLDLLKRQPQAVIGVCYPAPEGKLPWQLFEMLNQCGRLNVWNCVHYNDDTYLERKAAVDLSRHRGFEAELQSQFETFAATGLFGMDAVGDSLPEEAIDLPPDMLRLSKPDSQWEGVGITLINAPEGFEAKMLEVGSTLKEILGKPDGWAHKRLAPVHRVEPREYGESYKLITYAHKGFALSEEFQKTHPTELNKAYNTHFASDVIHALVPMDDEGAPTALADIIDDATNLHATSQHTKDIVQGLPGQAAAEAYMKGRQTPMERILGDMELYQMGRRAVKIEVAHKRKQEEDDRLATAYSRRVLGGAGADQPSNA
jgi:23S rRNA A2030 N6-methylase RlmJ